MSKPMSREQVEAQAMVIQSSLSYEGQRREVQVWLDTDVALREEVENYKASYERCEEVIATLEQERDFWNEQHSEMCLSLKQQVTALEQDRNEWKTAAQLNKGIYEPLHRQVDDLTAQVTELEQERDGLMRRIEEEEPIFHDMLEQLAASQERMKELEDWHLQAYADIKRNDELQAQLAEVNKDCDDLRALAERLMAKLSEGKVVEMVDDIKIMGEL